MVMRQYMKIVESLGGQTVIDAGAEMLFRGLPGSGWESAKIDALLEAGHDPYDHNLLDSQIDELVKDWCDEKVSNVYYEIEFLVRGGTLPVWREITAVEGWKPSDWEHPGIYWSWDKGSAEAHWANGSDQHVYLMSAELPLTDIDWPITLAMNANPDYEGEREIRIKPGVPVRVAGYTDVTPEHTRAN